MPDNHREILLEVHNLKKWFPLRKGLFSSVYAYVKAVDGVSFTIKKGETLGLVGESGCGKTTVGRCILRLIEPSEGEILFEGISLRDLSLKEMREMRKKMQIIFQDPYASLNPRMTISSIIGEALKVHKIAKGKELENRVKDLLSIVGLDTGCLNRYPHEFSGGQRQRIGIARALALNPKLIVADEPISALDVSIQAQVINLLKDLQNQFGIAYLFIAHNLSVVEYISHRVAVMYLGKIVEIAPAEKLYAHAFHPYSQALLSAVPIPDPTIKRKRIILKGDVPTPINPPSGCRFHPRCWKMQKICSDQEPPLLELEQAHLVACHFPD